MSGPFTMKRIVVPELEEVARRTNGILNEFLPQEDEVILSYKGRVPYGKIAEYLSKEFGFQRTQGSVRGRWRKLTGESP